MRLHHLNHLLAFVTVAEKRGFSAASRTLGVSPSALSQSVRALEAQVGTSLLVRTTRSVALTEAGERLLERSSAGLREAIAAVAEVARVRDEVVGHLRLTVPRISLPFLHTTLVLLRRDNPRLILEVIVDDKFVDLMKEGYDAGVRLVEALAKDLVAVRVAPAFRFLILGSPDYLNARGRPRHPRDLLTHDCVGFRALSSGALYVWELERAGRDYKVPVSGGFVTNDPALMVALAEQGEGLAYVPDFTAAEQLRKGTLESVLDNYMPSAPGLFLYFPSRAKDQPKMKALLSAIRKSRKADVVRPR